MATMLNASVEPMPVMVTTQMITPMAAQAMVTGSSRAPRHSKPARFFGVMRTELSGVSQLATMMAMMPRPA